MAAISMSFIDNRNGILNNSFTLSEEDMNRLYTALADMYRIPYDPQTHDPTPVVLPKECASNIAISFIKYVIKNVYDQEEKIALRKLNLQTIDIESA